MIPDLRFIIGAVTAVALLGFTLFGLVAAVHITHQSRVGPLEASRLLAYAPEVRPRIEVAPSVGVAPAVEEPFSPPADPEPVEISQAPSERAEPPAQPVTVAAAPDELPAAMPAVLATPVPTVAPSEPDDVRNTAQVQAAPEVQSAPDVQGAPDVQEPPQEPPDVVHVASIPRKEDAAETASEVAPAADEEPETTRPKAKRTRRAKRQVRRIDPVSPFASTGYPLFARTTTTTAVVERPAKGFWPVD